LWRLGIKYKVTDHVWRRKKEREKKGCADEGSLPQEVRTGGFKRTYSSKELESRKGRWKTRKTLLFKGGEKGRLGDVR